MVVSEDKIMSSEEAIREFILHGNPVQCAMVRKKLFYSVGVFDPELIIWSDADLWCRIFINGNKAAYFKTPQNCVRAHAEQGQRAFIKRDEHSIRVLSDHLGRVPDQSFIRNNTYYQLTFQHIQRLFSRIPVSSDLQNLRPLSAQWIFVPQINHLIYEHKKNH